MDGNLLYAVEELLEARFDLDKLGELCVAALSSDRLPASCGLVGSDGDIFAGGGAFLIKKDAVLSPGDRVSA
jgi:hypothetical protein